MKSILKVVFMVVLSSIQAIAQDTPTHKVVPPGWWVIPNTDVQLKFGGYVKFDMIHDFNPIGSPDFFDVSKIPTDGSEGTTTHLNAKETRLLLDVRKPTKIGEMRTYIEGDFYGTSGAFRLRHAFVEIGGKWLAGQWWSNFMDESVIPATLDFEKPAAYAFIRHPMLRYKHALSANSYLAFALEEPSKSAEAPPQPGEFESPLPDLTIRYRHTKPWGHIQLSGFAGQMRYRYDSGEKDNIGLFGLNLSGKFNILEKDNVIFQGVFGPGVGRYRGGSSVAPGKNDKLEALMDKGITLGYQHHWSPKFSSLVLYNQGSVDNSEGQPSNSLYQTKYIAANLVWYFTKNAFAGIEYLNGTREDLDKAKGSANRLQFSIQYNFN